MVTAHRIIEKHRVTPNGFLVRVEAPLIAAHARAGQFVILRVNETGERIPLTLARWDAAAGTIDLAFQVVGKTTALLSTLEPGDAIRDIAGPLGKPSEIRHYGSVAILAGGFGAGALLPIAQALAAAGNTLYSVVGARSADFLLFHRELSELSKKTIVMTDDGSAGRKGFVIDGLSALASETKLDHAYAIGPAIMMKFTALTCVELGIPVTVSLNPIMVDGTGMCGSCRVEVAGQTRFACIDGPEFDGSAVNWDSLLSRLNAFKEQEEEAYRLFMEKAAGGTENA
jgi:ferredoxin--NADP+ reductase